MNHASCAYVKLPLPCAAVALNIFTADPVEPSPSRGNTSGLHTDTYWMSCLKKVLTLIFVLYVRRLESSRRQRSHARPWPTVGAKGAKSLSNAALLNHRFNELLASVYLYTQPRVS